jgi:general secretion pathway protein F/type IV pilus assembly protein PilC
MAEFTYEALSATGERSTGTVTANSDREAMNIIDARGLFPVKIQSAQKNGRVLWQRGVGGRHMATFYSQLADLLRSGVPLLRSLDILERMGTNATLKTAIRDIRAQVADGKGLAQAMARYPRIFNELSVSMVRAGQEGGFLEDVLKRIAVFTENQEDLKGRVIGALAYPIFLAVAGSVILLGLFIFIMPKFAPIFAKLEASGQMPSLTAGLLATSNFLRGNWWLAAIALVILFIAWRMWVRTPNGRLLMDKIKIRIPAAGTLFLSLSLSRFTRILGTLLHNGIPILRSLEIAKDSTGNRVLTQAIEKSAENVTAGQKLAEPLGHCPFFPRDVVEMIAVAEESNNLENVLVEIADNMEKRTARQLELFVRLLEPAMLLVMGGIIGLTVFGLMLPIFKMGGAISKG